MTKNTAGERKRTVTVVLGPKTEALMNLLVVHYVASMPGYEQTITRMTGAALNEALTSWRKDLLGYTGEDRINHFD
jgi:hypothetical protein